MIEDIHGNKYYTPRECGDKIRKISNGGIDLTDSEIHRLMMSYKNSEGISFHKVKYRKCYRVDTFDRMLTGRMSKEFLSRAYDIYMKGFNIPNKNFAFNSENDNNIESDMEKYSDYLINNKYQMENISNKRLSQILHESIKKVIGINEIKHIAKQSPITVCSYDDFCNICKNEINVDDSNVESLIGKICFIEIGSTKDRCNFDYEYSVGYDKFNSGEDYFNHQFYFNSDHPNVLRLTFDDNMKINKEKQPIKLSKYELKPEYHINKNGETMKDNAKKTFYYSNGKAFDFDMAKRATIFIENNIKNGDENMKFIIHCRAGASRSAAFGFHIANLIKTDLNKYLSEYEYYNPDGTRTSQFNINWTPSYDKNGNQEYDKNGKEKGRKSIMNHRVYGMLTNYLSNRDDYDKNGFNFTDKELNSMGGSSNHSWMKSYVDFLDDYAKKNNLRKRQKLNK